MHQSQSSWLPLAVAKLRLFLGRKELIPVKENTTSGMVGFRHMSRTTQHLHFSASQACSAQKVQSWPELALADFSPLRISDVLGVLSSVLMLTLLTHSPQRAYSATSQPASLATELHLDLEQCDQSGSNRRLIVSSIDTLCIYNKIAGTG